MNTLLGALRPLGPIEPPANYYGMGLDTPEMHKLASKQKAFHLIHEVQTADASLPLKAGSRGRANLAKSDLGNVIDRPKIFRGTAKELREKADRLEAQENLARGQKRRKIRAKKTGKKVGEKS